MFIVSSIAIRLVGCSYSTIEMIWEASKVTVDEPIRLVCACIHRLAIRDNQIDCQVAVLNDQFQK